MLKTFYKFNQSVTSTNLWKKNKSAAAFRMDPTKFLQDHHIPEVRCYEFWCAALVTQRPWLTVLRICLYVEDSFCHFHGAWTRLHRFPRALP